jgi:hypothetical protein
MVLLIKQQVKRTTFKNQTSEGIRQILRTIDKHPSQFYQGISMSLHQNLVRTMILTIMALLASQTKILKENHQLHQHPFQYIGSGYTQDNGDDLCRQAYAKMGGYRTSSNIQWSQRSSGINVIYAHDGSVINGANHISYRQPTGECVADR